MFASWIRPPFGLVAGVVVASLVTPRPSPALIVMAAPVTVRGGVEIDPHIVIAPPDVHDAPIPARSGDPHILLGAQAPCATP